MRSFAWQGISATLIVCGMWVDTSSATPITFGIDGIHAPDERGNDQTRTLIAVTPPGREADGATAKVIRDEIDGAPLDLLAFNRDAEGLPAGYFQPGQGVALFYLGDRPRNDGITLPVPTTTIELPSPDAPLVPVLALVDDPALAVIATTPHDLVDDDVVAAVGGSDMIPNPEPASLLLLGTGLVAGALYARRKRTA